jgi:hypothetical protein
LAFGYIVKSFVRERKFGGIFAENRQYPYFLWDSGSRCPQGAAWRRQNFRSSFTDGGGKLLVPLRPVFTLNCSGAFKARRRIIIQPLFVVTEQPIVTCCSQATENRPTYIRVFCHYLNPLFTVHVPQLRVAEL